MQHLRIGFSPCPNDTFIFDAMVNQPQFVDGLRFDCMLEDVETLNSWAYEGKLDVTKLSYSAYLHLTDIYTLLDSGSALGRGVGPLLIYKEDGRKPAADRSSMAQLLKDARIAIPGKNTTANLLFSLAFPEAKNKTEVLFSEIEQAVQDGLFDYGLVIHESRFTYQDRGLAKLLDMGSWWEQSTGAAIPLGGICVRKDLPRTQALLIEDAIRRSLAISRKNYPSLSNFVVDNAQEMDESVMRSHINLYVNDYTTSLGVTGRQAVDTLFEKALAAGIIDAIPQQIYL